ncbi:MAG: hypothetical protein KGH60_01965 [Candidatus Micrarchaeota archaeon]|nr:hypothetical protein [Candidatus Micrarchaeota archaeon]
MAKKHDDKKKGKLIGRYVQLHSLEDLLRIHVGEPHIPRHIRAIKDGSSYKLFLQGERFGDTRCIYYVKSQSIRKFCTLRIGHDGKESAELKDDISEDMIDFKSFKVPIIEIPKEMYDTKAQAKFDNIVLMQIKDYASLVKALLTNGSDEGMPMIYSFVSKGARYIGTGDLIREGDTRVFTYSKVGEKEPFSALMYDYNTDRVTAERKLSDKATGYVKVINLAEPLPFFKPE